METTIPIARQVNVNGNRIFPIKPVLEETLPQPYPDQIYTFNKGPQL